MEHPKLPKTLSKNPLPKIHPINDENRNNFEGTPTHRNAITLGRPKFNKISPTNNVTDEDQFSSNKPNLTRNKSTPTIYPTTSNANPYEISITIPPLPEDGKPNNSVAAGSNQNLRITNPSIIKPAITLQRISKKNSLIPGTIIRSREELHDQRFLDTSFHKPTIAHSKSLTFENGISNHNFKHRRQSSSQSLNTALNYGKKTRDRQSVAFQLEVPLNGGSIQRQSALSIPTAEVDEKVSSSTLKKNIPSAPTRARGSLTPRMSISKTDGKVVELHENSLELSMLVFSPSALENLYARECLNKNYLIVMRAISLFSAFSCITFPGVYTETKTWWFWTIWLVSVTFYILIAIFTIPALKHTAVNLLESKSASYCKLILEMGIMLVLVVETLDLPGNSEPWGSVSVIIALVTGTLPGIAIGYLHALVAMFMQWLFPIVRSFFSQESIVTKLVTYFPISVCGMLVFPDLYNRDLRRRQGYKKSKILQRENRQLIIRQQEVDTLLELALPAHVAKVLRLLSDGEIQRPIHEETPYASLSLRVQSATVMFAEFHFLHQVKFDSGKSSRSMVNAMNFVFSKVDDYLQRVPTIEKIKTVGSKALFCLGLFEEARTPLEMVNLALYISDAFADGCKRLIEAGELNQNAAMFIETKMGIETGPLVAGIVGTNKFVYDIYGDTVNTSSRCLSASSIGQIVATKNVIEATKQWVKHESIGHRYLKGKGEMELFRIIDLYDHATIGVYCNTPEKSTTLPKHPPPSPLTPIPSNPTTTKYHSSESVSTPRSSLRDVIYAMGDDMSPRIPAAASVLFTPATNANGNVKEEIGRVLIKQLAKSASAASESIVFESAMVTDTLKTVNPITLKFLYDELESDYMNYYVWDTHKRMLRTIIVGGLIVISFWLFGLYDASICCEMMSKSGRTPTSSTQCNSDNCLDLYDMRTLSNYGSKSPLNYSNNGFEIWTGVTILMLETCAVIEWYCSAKDIPSNFLASDGSMTISEVLARLTQPSNSIFSRNRIAIRIALYTISYTLVLSYVHSVVLWRNLDRYRGFVYILFILVSGFGVSSSEGISFQNVIIISTIENVVLYAVFMVCAEIPKGNSYLAPIVVDICRFLVAHLLLLFTSWLQKRTLRDDFIVEIIADRQRSMTEGERRKSQNLLLTLFPLWVARWLESHPPDVPYPIERFESVTLLYSDIVGFTEICSSREPAHVITLLNKLFCGFDLICKELGIEKITTIGDAYFACGGLIVDALPKLQGENHATLVCRAALKMDKLLIGLNKTPFFQTVIGRNVHIRTGIHTGSVQGTVFGGAKKFRYDITGPAVNLCEETQTKSIDGKIMITKTTYDIIKDEPYFKLTERENFQIDGLQCYFLESAVETVFEREEMERLLGEQQQQHTARLTTILNNQ